MKKLSPRGLRLAFALSAFTAFSAFSARANTAIEPMPQRGAGFLTLHQQFLTEAKKGGIDVLFLGDSITDFWRDPQRGRPVWDANFAPLHAANFGISADRTQHVLWRLEQGEVDGLAPKVVVLLLGTNNTGIEANGSPRNTTAEAIQGVTLVVHTLLTKLPHTQILLLGIFPRADPKGPPPGSTQTKDINAALARLDDGKLVHFLDLGSVFLNAEGKVDPALMPDLVHPNTKGYQLWADALRAPLAALLKTAATTPAPTATSATPASASTAPAAATPPTAAPKP